MPDSASAGLAARRPFVVVATDGSDSAVHAAGIARRLLPTADFEIVSVMQVPTGAYADDSGIGGPALDTEALADNQHARHVAADAATAAAARATDRNLFRNECCRAPRCRRSSRPA